LPPDPPRSSSARDALVDDDVRDWEIGAALHGLDDAVLQPVEPGISMRREDDSVGREFSEPFVDGRERVMRADVAASLDSEPIEGADGLVKAGRGLVVGRLVAGEAVES
jgi:hypothetical protein